MSIRTILLSLVFACFALAAVAEEKINSFDVAITVQEDGDIDVSERLNVTSEGYEIRRGIFRDLPRYYADDQHEGDKLPYQYKVTRVTRNGNSEPYEILKEGNAYQIRIGNADRYLENGEHVYEIEYEVKNQIRYFEDHDELYWNVTGNYWLFPIEKASVRITLPEDAVLLDKSAYTGGYGADGRDYAFRQSGGAYVFETTRPLGLREGLTVSLSIEKGAIAPPSLSDKGTLFWFRYGALGILVLSFLGVLGFLLASFRKVGEDPPKGPVFAQYEPPAGYSPAAVHHIYYRGFRGHGSLISALLHMATGGFVDIDASDKKNTLLNRTLETNVATLSDDEKILENGLFSDRSRLMLGTAYDSDFTKAYTAFRKYVSRKYGDPYFKWNIGYTLVALILTVAVIVVSALLTVNWTWWHSLVVLAFAVLNGVFMYLMPAPTKKGQKIRTDIEGFRLYLETAEKLQLNAAEVGSETPPPMSKDRYEKFLPYAIALGVEKPWTKYFEKTLPSEAADYSPAWGHFGGHSLGNLSSMTDSMVSTMNSGVSGSLPQSSSSSGGGGGGFSGGGGGGGGGGGW